MSDAPLRPEVSGDPATPTFASAARPPEGPPQGGMARPTLEFMMSHPAHFIAMGLGSGLGRIAPGTEVQEIAELPRADRANPNAPHGLLMLRWDEEDPSHIQQREAFIATLTQSLEAPGAAKNTTGTAP